MSAPHPASGQSEITIGVGEGLSPGPFSLTALFVGEADGVEEVWRGALGQALEELFKTAGKGMQAARSTANHVMQSGPESITNMVNQLNLKNQRALQGA